MNIRRDKADFSALTTYPPEGRSDPMWRVLMRRAITDAAILEAVARVGADASRDAVLAAVDLDALRADLDILGLGSREQHEADLRHIGEAA